MIVGDDDDRVVGWSYSTSSLPLSSYLCLHYRRCDDSSLCLLMDTNGSRRGLTDPRCTHGDSLGWLCLYLSFIPFVYISSYLLNTILSFFSWAGHISPPFALYLHASYILPFDFFRFVCVKSFLLSKEKDLKGENWSVYFGLGSSRRSGDISFIVWALSKYALGDLSHLGVEHDEAQSDMRGLFHFDYTMLSSS